MVAINKFFMLAVVASVLVVAAKTGYAQEPTPSGSEGGVRAFGRKIVDGGSSILSHIPIVNKFFGHGGDKAAPVEEQEKAAPAAEKKEEDVAATPAAPAAEEEKAAVEEPAKADETPAAEEPAKEAEAEKPAEESQ